ncbi:HSP20-like chaperone [Pseudoneurospora amorphoporcata]|uniref:HSP20-like chaperone n=1 Tax=Pseudoneurospora amorphoporcata TaxID=241081 RepID=A0AAN6NR71_9PEZI|nr:HSP20-like chaperone [Pseudoneurospora amorphoporcata]
MVFNFPADFASSDPNFTTFFRLLDDFDPYSREVSGSQDADSSHPRRNRRGLNPRFDIRETKYAYELYGELPGTEREYIHIELTEPNTLLIYGRVDRDYAPAPGGEEEDTETGEERKEEGGEKDRHVGEFAREFAFPGTLPEYDIEATLEKGILKVVAPKQQPAKGRKIEIK